MKYLFFVVCALVIALCAIVAFLGAMLLFALGCLWHVAIDLTLFKQHMHDIWTVAVCLVLSIYFLLFDIKTEQD